MTPQTPAAHSGSRDTLDLMLIRLICWNEELAKERARVLAAASFKKVDASRLNTSRMIGNLRDAAPGVILIDLDRLPSHGFAVAVAIRGSKSLRAIPLVFAGGPEEKLARIRREFPDAVFTNWDAVAVAIKKAAAAPPLNPVKPMSHMERYGNSYLVKKLGFKPNTTVACVAAPEDFEEQLVEIPEGVSLQTKMTAATDLAIWFVRSRRELDGVADYLGARLRNARSAWIVYPKQAGRYKVDFNLNDVRATALEAGLVDYRICSVDADWTGMLFTRKK
jgi:hypothetical protein